MHPPLVRALLRKYTRVGESIHDPFMGSGTLIVEALALKRQASGTDIDPLAVFIAKAKTTRYERARLESAFVRLETRLDRIRRSESDISRRARSDLSAPY